MQKDTYIKFRLSKEDKANFQQLADRYGLTLSSWCLLKLKEIYENTPTR